jgi:hypothetical protein
VFYGGKAEARPGGGGEEDGDCARGGDE